MTHRWKSALTASPKRLIPGAALFVGVTTAVPLAFMTPPQIHLLVMGAVLLGQLLLLVLLLRRRARYYDIRGIRRVLLPRRSVEGRWPRERREEKLAELRESAGRARHGFITGPAELLERTAKDPAQAPAVREYAAEAVNALKAASDRIAPAPSRTAQFDVVMVSNFNLPGGTTSSNATEIRLLTESGKTVGLFHHPLYSANAARPVNVKIDELVDGEKVRYIKPRERVSCDLLLMRFPPFAMCLREDLPTIEAREKMLVINQAPMTYYDPIAGRKPAWNVKTVWDNLSGWIGEHRWTAVGPLVRQALLDHHSDEIEGIDLTSDYWYPALDLSLLARRPATPPNTPFRIGRHSRDHLSKWPELASELRSCYPEDPDFEIHVLGGTRTVKRILGRLPANWRSLGFDSMAVGDFLPGLDFYVYYPGSTLLEAFGRAPAEAMASGVPTILPPVFEPVFGEGAVYASPAEVRDVIKALADDPQNYLMQQKQGIETAHLRFGFEAHRERFRKLGIAL